MKSKTALVIFQPSGRRGSVPLGATIVEASRLLGVDIEAPCGGKQICGKCKIRVEQGVFKKFGLESKPEPLPKSKFRKDFEKILQTA